MEQFFWPGHVQYSCLANAYECKFTVDEKCFMSVDHYMWYERAVAWSSGSDLAGLIREAKTVEDAKNLSRRCTAPKGGVGVEIWRNARLRLMAKAVLSKFRSSAELRRMLLGTGRSGLLYASKYDAYYGIGFRMVDALERREEWGQNYLGRILEVVRERVRDDVESEVAVTQLTMCSLKNVSGSAGGCSRLECILCGQQVEGMARGVSG